MKEKRAYFASFCALITAGFALAQPGQPPPQMMITNTQTQLGSPNLLTLFGKNFGPPFGRVLF